MASKIAKTCRVCKAPFFAKKGAKTCSQACRKRLQRVLQAQVAQKTERLESALGYEFQRLVSRLFAKHVLHVPNVLADERGEIPISGAIFQPNIQKAPEKPPQLASVEPHAPQPLELEKPLSSEQEAQLSQGGSLEFSSEKNREEAFIAQNTEARSEGVEIFKFNRLALTVTSLVVAIIGVVGLASFFYLNHSNQANQALSNKAGNYPISSLPLNNLSNNSKLELGQSNEVDINGQLKVNNNLVLNPSNAPSSATAGEFYFDQTTKNPYYYNGSQFVSLEPTSLGGATGAISVGNGLQVTNNQLGLTNEVTQVATSLSNIKANALVYGNGTSTLQATNVAPNSILATNGSNTPSLTQTLPGVVQSNITATGTLGSGSINNGFGSINTTNIISTTGLLQGNVVNANGAGAAIELNGTNINTVGTLSNIAYLNAGSQTFTGSNTFSGNGTAVTVNNNAKVNGTLTTNTLSVLGSSTIQGTLTVQSGNFTVDAFGNINAAGTVSISGGNLLVGTAGTTAGMVSLANSSNSNLSILQPSAPSGSGNGTYVLPSIPGGTSDTVCLVTLANCTGGGGGISGSGTAGTIPKFSTSSSITDSNLSESGTTLTYAGALNVTGAVTLSNLSSAGVVHTNGSGVLSTGAVALGSETTGNYVANLGGLTGLSTTGNSGAGSTPTLSVLYGSAASTAVQGNTTFTCASGTGNLTGGGNNITEGSGGTCNNLTIVNSPSFSGSLTVQGAGGITVGVAGTTAGHLTLANATNSNLSLLQSAAPSGVGNATYTLPTIAGGSSDTVCLVTLGNCAGSGTGVTTPGGTSGTIALFTGSQSIGNSALTQASGNITDSGNLNIQGGSLTLGVANTTSGSISLANGASSNLLIIQGNAPSGSGNATVTVPTIAGGSSDQFCLVTLANCTGANGGSGNTAYIFNQTSVQANANFNIQSAAASSVGGVIRGASGGQTADLLELQAPGGSVLSYFDNNGDLNLLDKNLNIGTGGSIYGSGNDIHIGDANGNYYFDGTASARLSDATISLCTGGAGSCALTATGTGVTIGGTNSSGLGNSTTAFQIQDTGGTSNLFVADTSNTRIGIGAAPANALLTVGTNTNNAGGGIYFGSDTNLYRSAANTLNTDGNLNAGGVFTIGTNSGAGNQLTVTHGATLGGGSDDLLINPGSNRIAIGYGVGPSNEFGIQLGGGDTDLYRSAANTLKTDGNFIGGGTGLFKNASNSTTAFQIQNASGASLFNVDTSTTSNLITNGGFESGTTGWSVLNGSTLNQVTSQAWQGNNSLQIITGGAANVGASYTYAFTPSTTYTLSLYAKVASGSIGDITVGRQDNGSNIDCLAGQTLTTTWTRFSCTFTTGGTISGSNIYIKKTSASPETFYIDGVQLQTGSSVTAFNPGGAVQLNGILDSPLALQNASDSTTAFQIQNAAGTSNLLVADTANTKLGIATAPSSTGATLQVGGTISLSSLGSNGNTLICTNGSNVISTCGSGTGSGFFILNGTSTQSANFNIQSASSSSVVAVLQGASSQTADILQVKDDTGVVLDKVTSSGNLEVGTTGTPTSQLYVSGTLPTDVTSGGVSIAASNFGVVDRVQGHYAYVETFAACCGAKLQIFDITNPAAPTDVSGGGHSLAAGAGGDMDIAGHYAYSVGDIFGGGNILQIFDISNPSTPAIVNGNDEIGLNSTNTRIRVQGRYAYILNQNGGGTGQLWVVDVSSPASPVHVGTIALGGDPSDLYVQGRYAYITNGSSNTLQIIDLSNPSSPVLAGTAATNSGPGSVSVSGGYAYVGSSGSGGKLQTFDVSNPSSPIDVSSGGVATAISPSNADVSYVQGRYIYISEADNFGHYTFQVFDISTPATPVNVSGSGVALSNPGQGLSVQGRYAYIASGAIPNGKLQVFDLGGEYSQQLEAGGIETGTLQVDTNAGIAGDATIQGGLTVGQSLQTDGNMGVSGTLTVGGSGTATGQLYVSGTLPTAPVSTLNNGSTGYANAAVQGHYIYTTSESPNKLKIYDASNPASPVLIGSASTGARPLAIAVQGHYAYIFNATGVNMQVFDISNPSSPNLVSTLSFNVPGSGNGSIYVQGRYAYIVGINNSYFDTVDISNPTNPVILSTSNVSNDALHSVYVQGRYAYIIGDGSFTIYDVSNPAAPSQVYSTGTYFGAAVYVQGRYAYIAHNGSFDIYDISNPASPTVVAGTNDGLVSGYAGGVIVQGRYAYVCDSGSNSLLTINIANPASPAVVNTMSVGSASCNTASVVAIGRYVYALGYGGGLSITDVGGEYTQQLEAGGTETGTLQVDSSETVAGDSNIAGGLQVGQSIQASGNLGISGGSNIQGSTVLGGGLNGLSAPSTPTITPQGTGGSQRWDYTVTAVNAYGGETVASTAGTTSSGNATLSATNYNQVSWSAVTGATSYNIYRTYVTGATSPTTTGLIGSTTSTSFNDTGLAGSGNAAPTVNTTGQLTVEGASLFETSGASTVGLTIQGTSSQTADLLQLKDNSGNVLSHFDSNGNLALGTSSTPGALLQVGANVTSATPLIELGTQSGNYNALGNISTNEFAIQAYSNTHILRGYAYTSGNRKFNTSDYALTVDSNSIQLNQDISGAVSIDNGSYLEFPTMSTARAIATFNTPGINWGKVQTDANGNLAIAYKSNSPDSSLGTPIITFGVSTDIGNVGVGTSTPGNLLSVGALTTAAGTYQIGVSTGGTSNSGIVVQTVASQASGYILQAQDSTGATLASIDYQGNLSVKAATINGNLTLNGHLITGDAAISSPTAGAALGSGGSPSCAISGNQTTGTITLTTGSSGTTTGTACTGTISFGSASHPVISGADQASAALQPYVSATTTTLTIGVNGTPTTGGTTYKFNYFNAQ